MEIYLSYPCQNSSENRTNNISCQEHAKIEDANLKKIREDLQSRVDILQKHAEVSAKHFHLLFLSFISSTVWN